MSTLEARLIELCEAAGSGGVKQDDLLRGLQEKDGAADLNAMAGALNKMLKEGVLSIYKLADGTPVYRRQSTQEATRFQGLTSEERLVLQLIETSGNTGMWTRDIRLRSNLQQVQVPKILKTLETRRLIKAVKSVASKNKKMYMLYDLEPPHEPFYNEDQDLDLEFISVLQAHTLQYVASQGRACTLDECWRFIRSSRISNVELRHEDVQMLLDALVFDAKLEICTLRPGSAAAAAAGGAAGKAPVGKATVGRASAGHGASAIAYRPLHTTGAANVLPSIPCCNCTLTAVCQEGNEISPASCEYFTQWLEGVNNW